MATIWKTPLNEVDRSELGINPVNVPAGAKPLCVQMQYGVPTIWWYVDPANKLTLRRLRIVGSGWQFHEEEVPVEGYIGTVQDADGALVWHVFEV